MNPVEMSLIGRLGPVQPRVVPADRETRVTLRPPFLLVDGADYQVRHVPLAQRGAGGPDSAPRTVRAAGGALQVVFHFEGEQEHLLQVLAPGNPPREAGQFRLYSLAPDLFGRFPWKGDTHLHSQRSDGHESPAWVAGACRRIGLDFMAVTDHRAFAPSGEAQAAYAGVAVDLRICRGEEIHPPDNPAHLVNFGGRSGVHELCQGPAYRAEVEALQRAQGPLPPGVDPYCAASCAWCFARIREGGGLGIYCHPYWFTRMQHTPAGALTTHLFDTQPFDAYEVIGGYHLFETESNALQAARYHEERARGRRLPIVGASDAHGCENGKLFGWYYTVAFAPGPDLPDVAEAVRGLWSVAVEALPGMPEPRAVGPLRLVQYAQFLLREVFPAHDALCREEGLLMLAHAQGNPVAAASLASLQGRCRALYRALWA